VPGYIAIQYNSKDPLAGTEPRVAPGRFCADGVDGTGGVGQPVLG